MILCSFRDLYLSFGTKQLFNGAELIINQGDKIGLLGLNGKGKSTLFKILSGAQTADISTPAFTFDKSDNYSLFVVPQEIPSDISKEQSLYDIFFDFYPEIKSAYSQLKVINEKLESGNVEDKLLDDQKKVLDVIEHVGGWTLHDRYLSICKSFGLKDSSIQVSSLSGGGQKKILLALGLSSDRELILWDEPTNHLDIESIKDFEEELRGSKKTFILVTHDRYLLGKVTNRIFQIEHGKILSFKGGYQDYLTLQAQREQDRLKLLDKLKNSYRREDAWMKQGIKARGTRSKKRVENYVDIKNQIRELKSQARSQMSLSIESSQRKTKVLSQGKAISFGFENNSLFNEIDFSLYKGNKIGLVGPNGVGKTTFIKLIAGELKPQSGELKNADDLKVKVFNQKRDDLPPEATPFELLGDGTDTIYLPTGSTMHIHSYFKKFLFDTSEINRPISSFSGGEKNRLQLALNLKEDADIWIFDEPTNDLDLESLAVLEEALLNFKGSLLIISHDRAFLKNVTDRVFYLKNKKLEIFEGGYDQVEAYLDALTLEDELLNDQGDTEPLQKTKESQVKQPSQKLSSFERKEIEAKVSELENLTEKIQKVMNDLAANQTTQESAEKLTQLSEKLESVEEELIELYEKLE